MWKTSMNSACQRKEDKERKENMVKQIAKNAVIVTRKELGVNCWVCRRFLVASRCPSVFTCKYPERKNCRAVIAEIADLGRIKIRYLQSIQNIDNRIRELAISLQK